MFEAVHRWQQGRYTCVLENEINQMIVSAQLSIMGTCIHHCGPGGGGSGCKRVSTAVGPLRSGGCREMAKKKRRVCALIILYDRGAVKVFASNITNIK